MRLSHSVPATISPECFAGARAIPGRRDPFSILKDVIEAEEIRLDRWTVVFHSEDANRPQPMEITDKIKSNSSGEENTAVLVMNNYFGVGIDADLCLGFHNAREENPERFNSR